jgi:(p)ppGpp synthase/HD superfamily hydrolase
MSEIVARAQALATRAHEGQVDKAGLPYIGHPARVAARLVGDDEGQAVAWMHDVVEDTGVTAADLAAKGFSAAVVAAVVALTRVEGENPDSYYARVARDPLALRVKLADIADNTDPVRMANLDEATRIRLTDKYGHAVSVLSGETQRGSLRLSK